MWTVLSESLGRFKCFGSHGRRDGDSRHQSTYAFKVSIERLHVDAWYQRGPAYVWCVSSHGNHYLADRLSRLNETVRQSNLRDGKHTGFVERNRTSGEPLDDLCHVGIDQSKFRRKERQIEPGHRFAVQHHVHRIWRSPPYAHHTGEHTLFLDPTTFMKYDSLQALSAVWLYLPHTACLSACLPACLPVCLSVCLSVWRTRARALSLSALRPTTCNTLTKFGHFELPTNHTTPFQR